MVNNDNTHQVTLRERDAELVGLRSMYSAELNEAQKSVDSKNTEIARMNSEIEALLLANNR